MKPSKFTATVTRVSDCGRDRAEITAVDAVNVECVVLVLKYADITDLPRMGEVVSIEIAPSTQS